MITTANVPRILIVDDNLANRDVLARRLQRIGTYRTDHAADGLAGLEAIRAAIGEHAPFDVVLLDVMMPHMNGLEMLAALASDPPVTRPAVIMISAAAELETVVRCIELGADDYLSKPFNPTLLRARLGNVLEKKRLRDDLARQLNRLEAELAEARRQQLSMVPDHFPRASDGYPVDVHAVMYPAREVGGDLYDCFEAAPGVLCIAVGDVSDKGMPAALFMARTRSLLRGAALQHAVSAGSPPLPSQLTTVLNEELCKNNPTDMFVTLFVGFLELATGRLLFANAGHPRPLYMSAGHSVSEVVTTPDLPLGIIPGLTITDYELTLASGDALVIVSDGLADTLNPEGVCYSDERILADLNASPDALPETLCMTLAANALAFAAGTPAADDVTILALRRI